MSASEKTDKSVFELVDGLTPVDPEVLKEFVTVMSDDVIPEIVKVIEERRMLAATTRRLQLKS